MNILKLVNVYKKIKVKNKEIFILEDISKDIEKSKIYFITGSIGSGKTTLLHILANILRPTYGEVYYNGVLAKQCKRKMKKEISILSQNVKLFENLTVFENILIGTTIFKYKEVIKMMEDFDLIKYKNSSIYNLSGGEIQKVAILRCIVKTKEVLMLDEPTSYLDEKTSKDIIEFLKQINKKYKTTIIIITHDEKLIDKNSYQIKIENGKIKDIVY